MITNPAKKNNTSTKLTQMVSICSYLADNLGAIAKEYYFVRYIDSKQAKGLEAGSGYSTFTLTECANALNKTRQSVRKNLYEAQKRGIFWKVAITGDLATVRYKSEARIAVERGLEQLGAIARIPLDALKNLKLMATDAHAEALQRKSIQSAKKSCRTKQGDGKKQRVIPVSRLFSSDDKKQCQNWGAEPDIIYQGKRCTFVTTRFVPYGASQLAIAASMDRHEQTIRNRLSRSVRAKHGLTIEKTQLAVKVDEFPRNWAEAIWEAQTDMDTFGVNEYKRRYNFGNAVFILSCNVYEFGHIELMRQRWKRKQLKRWTSALNTPASRRQQIHQSTPTKMVTDQDIKSNLPKHTIWRKVDGSIQPIAQSYLTIQERQDAQIPY